MRLPEISPRLAKAPPRLPEVSKRFTKTSLRLPEITKRIPIIQKKNLVLFLPHSGQKNLKNPSRIKTTADSTLSLSSVSCC